MKILITGGSGFIGTYLAADLLEAGHNIVIYDRQPSRSHPDLCIPGDIRDAQTLARVSQGVDAIIHLAAEHRDDVRPISLYYDVNVGGAQNVVHACIQNAVPRILFTSTVALYGLNPVIPDETAPPHPFNDYGRSKLEAECVLHKWADADPTRSLTIIRPTVIFGEGNRGNVYNLLRQIAIGRFLMVGSGRNRKSMAYVRNFSRFLVAMLANSPGVHLYNYADKPDFTMEQLVSLVHRTLPNGRRLNLRIPYALGLSGGCLFDALAAVTGKTFPVSSIRIKKFCSDTLINTDKLRTNGFTPPYTIEDGLKRMIQCEF